MELKPPGVDWYPTMMKSASFLLAVTLLTSVPAFGAASDAPLAFAVAKLLADEGSFREALEAFEEAVELAPEDPFIRSEYAEFLTRLAELSRSPKYRQQQLDRALEQVEAAQRLAPTDLDVQQVVGQTFLAAAEANPASPVPLARAVEAFEVVRKGNPGALRARLTLGQIYGYQGRWGEAAAIYREILAANPRDRRTYDRLVDAFFNAGRTDEAEIALEEILSFDPEAPEARLALSEMKAQKGEHRAAIELIESGTEEFRASEKARQRLAVEYYLAGEPTTAMSMLDALGEAGQTGNLGTLRALILDAQGRNDEAVAQLRKLLTEEPDNSELSSTLSRILLRQGQHGEAAQVLARVVAGLEASENPDQAIPLRFEWADALIAAGDWAGVDKVMEPLQGSNNPRVRAGAGLVGAESLVRQRKPEDALALLARTGPQDPGSIARRAEILLELGKNDESLVLLDQLKRAGDEESILSAATLYQRLNRYPDAIRLLEDFLQGLETPPVRSLFLLGASYERDGEHDAAVGAFRKVLEQQPEFPEALNYLGYMWAERGENLEEALTMIQKAVRVDPDNGAYVDSLGWVFFQLGRHEEALTHLRRAAQLVPGDGTVLEHLGDALLAVGQVEEAREAYLRALELEDANTRQLKEKLGPLEASRKEEKL